MATVTFNDKIFVQEALQHLVSSLRPHLSTFTRDLSTAAKQIGTAVHVPLVSNVTATTFNQSYTGTGGTVAAVTVTLDQHRIATVSVTDRQMAESSGVVFGNFARQIGKGLAKIVLQDIWSCIITTNGFACVTTLASASFNRTTLTAFNLALNNNDVEQDMRSFVGNFTINDGLLKDTNIVQAYQYGGSEAIRDGRVPRVVGLDIYPSNIIPSNSISLNAFACHPDAIAVAMRSLAGVVPDGHYEDVRVASDDENGISFTWRRLYDPNTGTHYFNAESLFGYTVALTRNLVLSTTPTT